MDGNDPAVSAVPWLFYMVISRAVRVHRNMRLRENNRGMAVGDRIMKIADQNQFPIYSLISVLNEQIRLSISIMAHCILSRRFNRSPISTNRYDDGSFMIFF